MKSSRPKACVLQTKPKKTAVRKRSRPASVWTRKNLLLLTLEWGALGVCILLATMLALGSSAHSFSGSSFLSHLLPFAAAVTLWGVTLAGFLWVWVKWRGWLRARLIVLPALLALAIGCGTLWFVLHDGYRQVFSDLRGLVGGKQQAAQTALEHQIYAAYRRHSQAELQKMLERSKVFNPDILDASAAFGLDAHILQGIAATESSFLPRPSHDGGLGLFQITAVPQQVVREAGERLAVKGLDLSNPRHNAFVAAATLKYYLAEMKGDLFLGLLAYNIGPHNGGLRFIMQQYGASDFVTMQPYIKELPRDYPIRVLSYALAFKLWQQQGKLLAYQEGDNAAYIQRIGIPGFSSFY